MWSILRPGGCMAGLLGLQAFVTKVTFESPVYLFWWTIVFMAGQGCATAALQNATLTVTAADSSGAQTHAVMSGQAVAGVASSICVFLLAPGFAKQFLPAIVSGYFLLSTMLVACTLCFYARDSQSGALSLGEDNAAPGYARVSAPDAPMEVELVEARSATELALQDEEPTTEGTILRQASSSFSDNDDQEIPAAKQARPRTAYLYGVAVLLCFVCSLGVFPGVTVHIAATSVPQLYLHPILVLVFNLFDLAGRVAHSCFGGFESPTLLLVYSLVRFSLWPPLLLCNVLDSRAPVLFGSDVWPVLFTALLGLSNGHLASASMVFGCPANSATAMNLWLNAGLVLGSLAATAVVSTLLTAS